MRDSDIFGDICWYLGGLAFVILFSIGIAYAQSGDFTTEIGATNPPGVFWIPNNEAGSFAAQPANSYFCTASVTCTLPDAVGNRGRSILVVNNGVAITITYAFINGQTLNGSSSVTNTTQFQEDLITSDGANWYKK
jgi:hypothetical protein